MARPHLPDDERRIRQFNFVVNETERAEIERTASAYGLGLSEFFRRRALGLRLPAGAADRQLKAETTTALLRLGVNLNQIAKHMNAGRAAPFDSITDLIDRINVTMDKLDERDRPRPRP